jgi:hypothetical protein
MDPSTAQAVQVTPPGAGSSNNTSTTSTGAIDLSAFQGKFVVLQASVKTHIRFGTSSVGAADTTDIWLAADEKVPFFIPTSGARSYFRARTATGSGVIVYADASDV